MHDRDLSLLIRRLIVEVRAFLDGQQKEIEAIRKYTASKDEPSQPQPPLVIESKIQIPEEVRSEYYAYQQQSNRWQGGPAFIVSLLTLFVVITYTVFSFQQWDALTEGIEQTQLSLGILRRSLAIAERQTRAAETSAETARDAALQSKRAFVYEQRPFLIVETPTWVNQPGTEKRTSVNMHLRNIGRTPAVRVTNNVIMTRHAPTTSVDLFVAFMETSFHQLRDKTYNDKGKYDTLARHDIAPTDRIYSTAEDAGWDNKYAALTTNELAKLHSGDLVLFMMEIAKYYDSFGNSYETQACWLFWGTDLTTMHICDSHNLIK